MSVPDLQYVIEQVRASRTWDFTTKDGLCAYTNACVCALYAADPNFGHLTKSEGQNHCVDPAGRYSATDVTLYRPTGQVVDFIVSAGYGTPPPSNDVCWHEGPEGEYPDPASWFAPTADGNVTPPTPPPDDVEAQVAQILHLCEQTYLYVSNMNAQVALMAGEVNKLRALQNPPYEGKQVLPGKTLSLVAVPPPI